MITKRGLECLIPRSLAAPLLAAYRAEIAKRWTITTDITIPESRSRQQVAISHSVHRCVTVIPSKSQAAFCFHSDGQPCVAIHQCAAVKGMLRTAVCIQLDLIAGKCPPRRMENCVWAHSSAIIRTSSPFQQIRTKIRYKSLGV